MSSHRMKITATLGAIMLGVSSASAGQNQDKPPAPNSDPSSPTPAQIQVAEDPARDNAISSDAATTPASSGQKAVAAATTSSELPSSASDVTTRDAGGANGLKRATDHAQHSTVAKLRGQRLRDAQGNELGRINDFVVDADSGEILHVVISSGGMFGVGDKLRLMPHQRLEQSAVEGFHTEMPAGEFAELPTVSEKDLKSGHLPPETSGGAPRHAVRASQLKNKPLRSDERHVGQLEHVVVDLSSGKAMALVKANNSADGALFLVPFEKLEVRSEDDPRIATSLTSSDFSQLQPASELSISSTEQLAKEVASNAGAPSDPTADASGTPASAAVVSSSGLPTADSSANRRLAPENASPALSSDTSRVRTDQTDPDRSAVFDRDRTKEASPLATTQSVPGSRSAVAAAAADANPTPSENGAAPGARSKASANVASTVGADSAGAVAQADNGRVSGGQSVATGDAANSSASIVTTTPSPLSPAEEPLTPTGRTSAEQGPPAVANASAIRHALDNDRTLAGENVEVTAKVVLRGSVQSEETKRRVEQVARQAAANAEIENQITVERK